MTSGNPYDPYSLRVVPFDEDLSCSEELIQDRFSDITSAADHQIIIGSLNKNRNLLKF